LVLKKSAIWQPWSRILEAFFKSRLLLLLIIVVAVVQYFQNSDTPKR
jgi:hypothetical protein